MGRAVALLDREPAREFKIRRSVCRIRTLISSEDWNRGGRVRDGAESKQVAGTGSGGERWEVGEGGAYRAPQPEPAVRGGGGSGRRRRAGVGLAAPAARGEAELPEPSTPRRGMEGISIAASSSGPAH